MYLIIYLFIYFLATEPLKVLHGTLGFHGTQFENLCSKE